MLFLFVKFTFDNRIKKRRRKYSLDSMTKSYSFKDY